jgi:hypothetical protein
MGEVERDRKAQDNGALILFLFKHTVMDIACQKVPSPSVVSPVNLEKFNVRRG